MLLVMRRRRGFEVGVGGVDDSVWGFLLAGFRFVLLFFFLPGFMWVCYEKSSILSLS